MQIHKELFDALNNCAAQCTTCYEACLREQREELTRCMRLNKECVELCKLTIDFVKRNSENEDAILEACLQACQNCAWECEKHNHDHCRNCARACKSCVEACEKYLKEINIAVV